MYYSKEFDEIRGLWGCFNQDWVESYVWEEREPTFEPVVRYHKINNSEETIDKLIMQIQKLLALQLEERDFNKIMTEELWAEYTPRSQGFTKRQFLEQSLKILKEPIAETKKHFIPKFKIVY